MIEGLHAATHEDMRGDGRFGNPNLDAYFTGTVAARTRSAKGMGRVAMSARGFEPAAASPANWAVAAAASRALWRSASF